MNMPKCEVLEPRWNGPVIVAATGRSLNKIDPEACRGFPIIAVKEAWERFPFAEVLYACDNHVWERCQGFKQFNGERWSTHHDRVDHKYATAAKYGIRLVRGEMQPGFSTDPAVIHYGPLNSLFQAIGFAIHWIRRPGRIVLLGCEMSGGWFFGPHPRTRKTEGDWAKAIRGFDEASRRMPDGIEVIVSTPQSLLRCFPYMPLADALAMRAVP
jgi:hypothetical protein